jgi:hypothetical protein
VPALTHQDLHACHTDGIRAELTAAPELTGPPGDPLRVSREELLRRRTLRYPLPVLPLAVCASRPRPPDPEDRPPAGP